ncbi:MAG: hypothetical protein WDW36_007173 [Sanguina aurantia]
MVRLEVWKLTTAPPKQLINNIAQKVAKVTPLGGDLAKSRPSKAADTPYWTTNQGQAVKRGTATLQQENTSEAETPQFDGYRNVEDMFDPVVEAEQYPAFSTNTVSGQRQQVMIPKENNFKQAGDRFRSFDAARQGRFVERTADMLSHHRVTQEIKDIWVDFLTQCDTQLGASIAAKLQAAHNGSAAPQPAEVTV